MMRERPIPPALIAVIVIVVVVLGFVAYQAAQPPAATSQNAGAVRAGIDPKNPARPPVDEHANDWHPPTASAK